MSLKAPREDFRANEEDFFHRRDVELIEEIRQRERAKAEAAEKAAHRGHCATCGGTMRAWHSNGLHGFVCTECEQVELHLQTLQALISNQDSADVLKQISQDLRRARLKTA